MRFSATVVSTALLAAAVFTGIAIWIGASAKSPTENVLASVFLSIVSIAASWVVAHHYYLAAREAEIDRITEIHNASLRTYALKAAEKVTNLSSELSRLLAYLNDYLETEHEEDDLDVILSVREQRVIGAIHIVEILRSVNETSLSDWRGVIGEELEKKKEEDEEREVEREQRLIEIADKINLLIDANQNTGNKTLERDLLAATQQMRSDLAAVISKVAPLATVREPYLGATAQKRPRVYAPCPQCGNEIRLSASKKGKVHIKSYICNACSTKLVSRTDDQGKPFLDIRAEKQERVKCPSCGRDYIVLLENVAGVSVLRECDGCGERFKVNRTPTDITIMGLGRSPQRELDADLVASIKNLLPQQPWPTGIATEIAERLGVPKRLVNVAVDHLIAIGVFRHQVAGKLYNTLEEAKIAQMQENRRN